MVERVPGWFERLLLPRLSSIEGELKAIDTRIDSVEKETASLRREMSTRFEAVNSKFDGFERRIDARFEAVNTRFDGLERRIDVIRDIEMLKAEVRELREKISAKT